VADLWFSLDTPVSSTNKKTDHHDITEILLKVALNTIFLTLTPEYINYTEKNKHTYEHHTVRKNLSL
jgi:hypothetical protein